MSPSTVSVVAADSRCQALADAMARSAVGAGVRVTPDASVRLLLNLCALDVRTELDVTGVSTAMMVSSDNPGHIIRAKGSAVLTVEVDGRPAAMLKADGSRVRPIKEQDGDLLVQRAHLHRSVLADMVDELVVQLWPTPVHVRRRWFRAPEPGSWQEAHNKAVNAERAGRCADAIRMATEAVNSGGGWISVEYLGQVRSDCQPG